MRLRVSTASSHLFRCFSAPIIIIIIIYRRLAFFDFLVDTRRIQIRPHADRFNGISTSAAWFLNRHLVRQVFDKLTCKVEGTPDGILLIQGAPASGKTSLLLHLIEVIMATEHRDWNVFAVTFTGCASELSDRWDIKFKKVGFHCGEDYQVPTLLLLDDVHAIYKRLGAQDLLQKLCKERASNVYVVMCAYIQIQTLALRQQLSAT